MITSEMVVDAARRQIELNGLNEAKQKFQAVSLFFMETSGWADAAREVNNLFIEEKKRMEREKAQSVVVDQSRHTTINANNAQYTEN